MATILKRLVLCVSLAATLALLAGSGAAYADDTIASIKQKGVVTVGTEAAFPPFEFVQDGKIVGYSKDILDSIVADLGVKLNQLDVPFDGLYPGLLSGKWDFIATTLLEWEVPAKKFAMTYPIAEGSPAILRRKGDQSIKTADDFNGHVIGTQVGTGSAIRLQALNDELKKKGKPGFDLKLFNSSPEFVVALANKQIDAAVGLLPQIEVVAKKQPDMFEVAGILGERHEYLGWATRPDDKPLRDYLSARIKALRDSGKLYEWQEKWFGFRMELPDSDYLPPGAI
jgi:polar amino acid transport system substrate-binding protein